MPSPRRFYSEPSPSQRRALVIATASLRQLVEFKGAVQLIHKCAPNNPHMQFRKTTHALQIITYQGSKYLKKPKL